MVEHRKARMQLDLNAQRHSIRRTVVAKGFCNLLLSL